MTPAAAPARRWLIEAAVIVGSILVAFAVDAWWDDRRDAEARQALYDAYSSDIATMRVELERVREFHMNGEAAIRELLKLRDSGPLGPGDASRVDSLIVYGLYGSSFDAPAGAARAIVSSGDLSYLENPELIAASNELLAQIESLEREQRELGLELNGVSAALATRGVDMADVFVPPDGSGAASGRGRDTSAWSVVTGSEVRSAFVELYWQYYNTVQILADIEMILDRIESTIQQEG